MTRVRGLGLLTGWGVGPAALPVEARATAGGRRVVPVPRPALDGERFRRATRECLLGVAAVELMLEDAGLTRDAIRGADTALIYVTAAAYGASNVAFIAGAAVGGPTAEPSSAGPRRSAAGTLHFPYTAPSVVPAEVAIEYGLRGGYVILIGGAVAAIDGIWQAGRLLAAKRCARALVLAVETFADCAALWRRGRFLARGPLVEAAACVLLEGDGDVSYAAASVPAALEAQAARRAGETLACAPFVALALAREANADQARLTGTWRGRRAAVTLELAAAQPSYA